MPMHLPSLVTLAFALGLSAAAAARPQTPADPDNPLPRWREGGTPPVDPDQPLAPYALRLDDGRFGKGLSGPPTAGLVASPPEYDPVDGVIFSYGTGWSDVVTACVAALTGDPLHDEKAYVVVTSASQQTSATNAFTAAGADLSKVEFVIEPMNSVWLRDYGPHFVWQGGALAIADSHYYSSRPSDNYIPTLLADDEFLVPAFPMGLYYSGGNFQPGPGRSGFITSLIYSDNPSHDDLDLLDLYHEYQGIDTLHVFPRLPGSVDGTGHVDMWMYLVDEDSVIISEFKPGSNGTAITITNDAVPYMENLGFQVHRVPAWNSGGVHYTYANAFRVNDRIFVPIYGPGNSSYLDEDQDALTAWQAAAGPGVEIVPINCYSIIPAAGAIHCIVMQVPRYTAATPAAQIVAPDGGELLAVGANTEIRWAASDDQAVTGVDILYSTDGGATFPNVIATGLSNDGRHPWTVPASLTTQAVVKVVARDADLNQDESASETFIEISNAPRTVYDFSSNAGVDRWGYGYRTQSWSQLDATRYPTTVTTEVSSLVTGAYAKLATSNATGGDSDSNRYISPGPGSGYESTHLFVFTIAENPATIRSIDLLWEGYGDTCLQMEMYVWDNVAGNWGDGRGEAGENHYVANFAGNEDEDLSGRIKSGFARYIDGNGRIALLLYAERSSQESFHDYVAVTVTHGGGTPNPWSDLGHALAGSFGLPSLTGTGPVLAGQPVNLIVENARENALAALLVGQTRVDAPFKGGTLVPSPDALFPFATSGSGNAVLSAAWPAGIPSGSSTYFQVWVADAGAPSGFAATNGLAATVP